MTRPLLAPLPALMLGATIQAAVAEDELPPPVHIDAAEDRLLLEIREFGQPMIYTNTLATGLVTHHR